MPLREGYLSILWPLLPVLIAISLWFGVKAGGDSLLRNNTARSGIGSLARAGTVEQAQWIIGSWNRRAPDRRSPVAIENPTVFYRLFSNEGRMLTEVAKRSLVFDLFFIAFYASTMAVACLLAATEIAVRSRKRKPRLVAFGIDLAYVQIVTASMDVVENLALWRMLKHPGASGAWPLIAYTCSIAKYALLAISLSYILIAFIFWLIDHRRRPVRKMIQRTT